MITLNKFALNSIGKYSLGRSCKETSTTEFFAIKMAIKSYKKGTKESLASWITYYVKTYALRELAKYNNLIHLVNNKDITRDDVIANNVIVTDKKMEKNIDREFLAYKIKSLNKNERKLISEKFGLVTGTGKTNAEIAVKEGVTAEAIRVKIDKIITKMRGDI